MIFLRDVIIGCKVFPPDSPPLMEGNEGETMDQPTCDNSHVEYVPTTKIREYFSTYDNHLVQQPPTVDSTFHFPPKGKLSSSYWVFNHPSDDTIGTESGPNAPFWKTSLGQSISDSRTTTTELEPSILSPLRKVIRDAPSNAKSFHKSIERTRNMGENIRRRSFSQLLHL